MESTGAPKPTKGIPGGQKGPQRTATGSQTVPQDGQREPKGVQRVAKGTHRVPTGRPRAPKGSRREFKVGPKEAKGTPETPKERRREKIYISNSRSAALTDIMLFSLILMNLHYLL